MHRLMRVLNKIIKIVKEIIVEGAKIMAIKRM
jgi:hypothetical protein